MTNFIEELRARSGLQDIMPEAEAYLNTHTGVAGYIGFDPTADSLHIGNLATLMMLVRFQQAGHKPIVLVGGATGLIGDPSGKSAERNLLDANTLAHNVSSIGNQLEKYLNFGSGPSDAEMVNNYDWYKEMNVLSFLRDVGKHLTLNYMMAKDSVRKRIETGISYTEFTYQLLQGYDFYWLWKNKNCMIQMGGSDQWGNITAGTELVRRLGGGAAYGLTCPLLTKSDGAKFGKSEQGNIWLCPKKTSPYRFYQFLLNVEDQDAAGLLAGLTLLSMAEIEALRTKHAQDESQRLMQKELARVVSGFVHSQAEAQKAEQASQILFGAGFAEQLASLDEDYLLSILEGVPMIETGANSLESDLPGFLSVELSGQIFSSKGEARKMLQGGGVSINKIKIGLETSLKSMVLLQNKYLLVQKGKKNFFLVKIT